ncbi:hypothetical protein [Caproiciproducens sp.]|uniref:hypothetical protein n=1 Tax=Caproiciproducens sp. TaxID=1954376 RepID=UPI00289A34F2|nr:hypothetical protein [Caproiciproducens sp.]
MNTLDRLVSAYAESMAAYHAAQESEIYVCNPLNTGVQVHVGIEKLAESAKITVHTEPQNNDTFPVEKSFVYHGVRFYQFGTESVETEGHAV